MTREETWTRLKELGRVTGAMPSGEWALNRTDLSHADLSHADLSHADLSHADLSHADLSKGYLHKARLTAADLKEANLSGADLSGASLGVANLSGADLSGASLGEAYLYRANLSGANLSGADLTGAGLTEIDLTNAKLKEANLSGADLTRANLAGADLSSADLSGAKLIRGHLNGAKLSGAILPNANLMGAKLSGADLNEAKLSGADLSGADLSGANLGGASLYKANLARANLSESDLTAAGLIRATLIRAKFIRANLSQADLNGADLNGADLNGADLNGADLNGADLRGVDMTTTNVRGARLRESDLDGVQYLPEQLGQMIVEASEKEPIVHPDDKTLLLVEFYNEHVALFHHILLTSFVESSYDLLYLLMFGRYDTIKGLQDTLGGSVFHRLKNSDAALTVERIATESPTIMELSGLSGVLMLLLAITFATPKEIKVDLYKTLRDLIFNRKTKRMEKQRLQAEVMLKYSEVIERCNKNDITPKDLVLPKDLKHLPPALIGGGQPSLADTVAQNHVSLTTKMPEEGCLKSVLLMKLMGLIVSKLDDVALANVLELLAKRIVNNYQATQKETGGFEMRLKE